MSEETTIELGEFGKLLKEKNFKLKALGANALGTEMIELEPGDLVQVCKELKRTKIRELVPVLKEQKEVDSIVLDGIITKRLLDEAKNHSIKFIIGVKKGKIEETPEIKTLVM